MEQQRIRWSTVAGLCLAAWTGLALFSAAIRILQENAPPERALKEMFLAHYLMALLSIPVWFWIDRVLAPRGKPIKALGHLLGALTYAVTWLFLYLALYPLVLGWQAYASEPFQYYYLHLAGDAIKTYILIAVSIAAWTFHRKREEAGRVAAEQRAEHRQMELTVLKAQLNPHFLFNCLNSVNALVGRDPERARAVLADLGRTLRYSLESDQRFLVPLRDELSFLDTYLAIEGERFGDRIRVERRIDPGLDDFPIPPMIVQPLVENALVHGLMPKLDGGVIWIEVTREGFGIRIAVTDDGEGTDMPLASLLTMGRGLHHTQRRLRVQYPGSKGLAIECDEGRFRVSAHIPRAGRRPDEPARKVEANRAVAHG